MMAFEFCKICTGFLTSRTIFWPGRNFTKSANNLILREERDGGRVGLGAGSYFSSGNLVESDFYLGSSHCKFP